MTETANPAIQAVIEAIEALSIDERESLFDILRQRRIEARRQEIAQNGEKTMEAVRNGTAKRGTPEEIMAYLLAEVDKLILNPRTTYQCFDKSRSASLPQSI